jgi:tetratricopeptide (TPR) repeat protein
MGASNDLFLSYRWADKASVEPLVAALSARGVSVWQDAREVQDSSSIQHAVSTGLAGARALLAWYSSRYNESRACQWELTSAYCAAQAEGDPRRRILVVNLEAGNKHVHLPELFDQLHFSGAGVPDDPLAVDALAGRIQAALRDKVPATPLGELRPLTPPRWLPSMGTGSTRFVGRLRHMWQLHGQLLAGKATMLTGAGGKPGLALVHGAGGIGKSLMAEEYALRFGAAYPGGVFWVRAHGHPDGGTPITPAQRANLRDAQVIDLAMGLGIDTKDLEPAQVRAAMARHFQHQAQPFLWVVDDLPPDLGTEALSDWLAPHPYGCTLFTTRTRRFTHVATLELPQLDPDEARGLLTRQRRLTPEDAAVADQICAALGYHALAVDVTAALIERRGLEGTLHALRNPDRDALALAAQFDEALPNGHQREIAATFLDSIRQLDEPARDLLRCAAMLAAAPIPRLLLVRGVAAAARIEGSDAEDRTDLAVDLLLSSSLADDAGNGAITVHTLVSRTMRFSEASPDALVAWRNRAVHVLTVEMTQAADIRRHGRLEPWVEHARELSASGDDLATIDLLGWVARYDHERAAYPLARGGYERQREIRARVLGEEHRDTLVAIGNLGLVLLDQGDLPGARRLHEVVLEVRMRVLGEEHPDTLTAMSNLASTLGSQGDLPGARLLEETVLDVSKRVHGDEHTTTLRAKNNLAGTLRSQGDLVGARRLEEAVLEVSMRVLGEEHPNTLTTMSNLAGTLQSQGGLSGARLLQEAVLDALKRAKGPEHPDTLMSMNNLANMLFSQGDLTGSRRLLEVVLEVQKRVLGEEHPNTLSTMSNLADTMRSQGDLVSARRLQEVVLGIATRVLGDAHPATLTFTNHLAGTLFSQGDLAGARRLEEAVLEASKRVLGAEHPGTLSAMNNLAISLSRQGDLAGARRLQEAVLEVRKRDLGEEHPDTLTSMNNLALTFHFLGDLSDASRLEVAALDLRKRVLGVVHPDTLTSMHNLAKTLWRQGLFEDARRLQEKAVEGFLRTLGRTHPHAEQALQAFVQMGGVVGPGGQPH